MTEMATYLDISVEGIQRYLGRTPDLKGRRGASAWLSEATDRDRLDGWLATEPELRDLGVRVNPEAGEADGKVPLRLPVGADARRVALAVLGDLRRLLPGARMRAVWTDGTSYLDAYPKQATAPDSSMITTRQAPGDFPPLEVCGRCRIDPAVTGKVVIHDDEDPVRLCADCDARYRDRYRGTGLRDGTVPVDAEHRLLRELGLDDGNVVPGFDQLAQLGEPDGNRNHLATVAADGNGIGALFGEIARQGRPEAKAEVSAAVSAATRRALRYAAGKVLDGDGPRTVLPVIPHVVGGDDLLVSVVADRAWRFVLTYLDEFGRRLREDPVIAPYWESVTPPSTSAGVVFARATFSFRYSVELADDLLRHAKKSHRGAVAAVSWLDVTRDGHHRPPHRAAWAARELHGHDDALRALRAEQESARAVLEQLINLQDPAVSRARLREYARRLERRDVLEPFLSDMDESDGSSLERLADALSLARWWR